MPLDRSHSMALRQAEQFEELNDGLMRAENETLRRIDRELHDGAGQSLTALGLNLALLARHAKDLAPQLTEESEACAELVQELSQEIRTMSYLLHPPLLEEQGLPDAIKS